MILQVRLYRPALQMMHMKQTAASASYASKTGARQSSQQQQDPSSRHPSSQEGQTKPTSSQPKPSEHTQWCQEGTSHSSGRKHETDPAHKPQTGQEESSNYILTLHTTPEIFYAANTLREKYFPKPINKTPAHITLFHALPGSKLDKIRADLEQFARMQTPFSISTGSIKRLRHGAALLMKGSYPAKEIHSQLKGRWMEWLSQQDRGGFQGHYTVMNKVEDSETIDRAIDEIGDSFRGAEGQAQGLTLWKYDKGRWRLPERFYFSPDSSA